jgi:hypothetical protein
LRIGSDGDILVRVIPNHPFILNPAGVVPATPATAGKGDEFETKGMKSVNNTLNQNVRPETSCQFPEEIVGGIGDPDDMHTKEGSV